jgi:hypothetical protein
MADWLWDKLSWVPCAEGGGDGERETRLPEFHSFDRLVCCAEIGLKAGSVLRYGLKDVLSREIVFTIESPLVSVDIR